VTYRAEAAWQDWPAIADWIAGQGGTLDLADVPRQFAGGLANLNYRVTLDGRPAVFRRPPAGPLAHGASDMAREARVLGALAPAFPLAPRLLLVCADPQVIGVAFQLIEWRPGVAVPGCLPAGFVAEDSGWMTSALAGALASLHALDPVALGLGDLGRPAGFADRQLGGWTRRADAAFGAARPRSLDPLLDRLGAALPCDRPGCLLHMDPKFDNLLLDPAARAARAVIDWDMATLGAPAFDLAVLLSYWIEPDDPVALHPLAAIPSLTPGWPPRAAAIAAYAAAAGSVPPDLAWYLALARLRLAAAWMQLYRLWERGSLTGDRYAGFAALSGAILGHALDRFGEL
jgi:aminoglycoside phosphotransferase (APT) family kinase protein